MVSTRKKLLMLACCSETGIVFMPRHQDGAVTEAAARLCLTPCPIPLAQTVHELWLL